MDFPSILPDHYRRPFKTAVLDYIQDQFNITETKRLEELYPVMEICYMMHAQIVWASRDLTELRSLLIAYSSWGHLKAHKELELLRTSLVRGSLVNLVKNTNLLSARVHKPKAKRFGKFAHRHLYFALPLRQHPQKTWVIHSSLQSREDCLNYVYVLCACYRFGLLPELENYKIFP